MKKADLIKSLAESVGMTDMFDTKTDGPRYDASTGTLYCDGIVLPHSSIEREKEWYRRQMETYRAQAEHDALKKEYFLHYAIAYNAICMLEDNINT